MQMAIKTYSSMSLNFSNLNNKKNIEKYRVEFKIPFLSLFRNQKFKNTSISLYF